LAKKLFLSIPRGLENSPAQWFVLHHDGGFDGPFLGAEMIKRMSSGGIDENSNLVGYCCKLYLELPEIGKEALKNFVKPLHQLFALVLSGVSYMHVDHTDLKRGIPLLGWAQPVVRTLSETMPF
jgi:hypothetical protein